MNSVIRPLLKASGPLAKITGWFFICLSIIFAIVAFVLYLTERSFVHSAVRTQGIVTRLIEDKTEESHATYRSVVSFRDANDAPQEAVSFFGTYPAAYKVGDKATVLYPPGHADQAKLDSFFDVWGLATIFGISAAAQLLFGLATLLILGFIRRLGRTSSSAT
jgi:hypothetical protein